MSKLIECVPNFSEGRDKGKVDAIVAAARSVPGVRVLDVEMDADHHRSVLSFVAPPETVAEAAFAAAAKACELIDLTRHQGEHPRMGAVDVIPFIPVAGVAIVDCVRIAERLGERIARELGIPVYLYDRAARRPERQDLAKVRKGQFEAIREEMGKLPERAPDFGAARVHPTAGVVAVGAREQIINFNVNLSGLSMEDAKAIAKKVRASGGGLPCLRAKEIDLAAKGLVQISTVLTDYKTTSIAAAFDAVASEAAALGAEVAGTEIVGLIPRRALMDFSIERMKVENFDPAVQVLEDRLDAIGGTWQAAASRLAEAFASTDPTPGGGSAAGVAAMIGCALGRMAAGVSLGSKKLEEAKRPKLERAALEFAALGAEFERLTGEDAASFEAFVAAAKLSKEDPGRPARMQAALLHAAEVPLATAQAALAGLRKARSAKPDCAGSVASDANCAAHLLRAAALCALENVEINAASLKDPAAAARLRAESARVKDALDG